MISPAKHITRVLEHCGGKRKLKLKSKVRICQTCKYRLMIVMRKINEISVSAKFME